MVAIFGDDKRENRLILMDLDLIIWNHGMSSYNLL